MGAEGAVDTVMHREIAAAEDKRAKRDELIEYYRDTFSNPYVAAARQYVDEVIEPANTRAAVAYALDEMHDKRELRPPKKHGLIPL